MGFEAAGAQFRAELFQPARDVLVNRLGREAEPTSRLAVRESMNLAKQHHLASPRRQGGDGVGQELKYLVGGQALDGIRTFVRDWQGGEIRDCLDGRIPLAAEQIDHDVARYLEKKCFGRVDGLGGPYAPDSE